MSRQNPAETALEGRGRESVSNGMGAQRELSPTRFLNSSEKGGGKKDKEAAFNLQTRVETSTFPWGLSLGIGLWSYF